jgi:hypothetical protein
MWFGMFTYFNPDRISFTPVWKMAIFIAGLVHMRGGRLRNLMSDIPAPPQLYAFYPSQLYLHTVHFLMHGYSWIFLPWRGSHYSPSEHYKMLTQWQLTALADKCIGGSASTAVCKGPHTLILCSYTAVLFLACLFSLSLYSKHSDC